MGVPAFFRWLTRKYPSVIVDAVEEKPRDSNGNRISVNSADPNPNFQEFDNLYLDMNGIIHPCTHPEDRPPPQTEDEMFVLIFEYIDRIFAIVRPRRLLYMAIDGVAPRAKMNQQRSRRFRASKEAAEKSAEIAEIRAKLEAEGFPLPPSKNDKINFDSNCITPGTPFMSRLAVALRYYIHKRLNSDPGWQKIEVILSDANVPGEGEHKIMDFIRRQRSSASHDPNTVHCLCGADADLIMLGLATHESNFNIIREEFIPNQQRPCELCGQYGHEIKECRWLPQDESFEFQPTPLQKEISFIFVRIPVLREYLERELAIPNSPIPFDLERSIDDWVFMCFFVGNDFLPHLPSLEIRENAIDRLIKIYKEMIYKWKGYLTDSGNVYMERVQMILNDLGEVEDGIFKSRQERELVQRKRAKARRRNESRWTTPAYIPSNESLLAPLSCAINFSGADTRVMARDARIEAMHYQSSRESQSTIQHASRKRKHEDASGSDDEPYDEVRLWESGWKERYYKSKFGVDGNDVAFRRKVAWAYVEGLCWVLKYYYQGCVSWNWYFPYHYAPFASDCDTVSQFLPNFSEVTEPFKPLQQLMSVFPAASRQHLPAAWQELMTSSDSPIIDFYPNDFRVDLNGKKFAWQGVALLPFVDEKRLLETLDTVEEKLSEDEKKRNIRGSNKIFVGCKHPLYKFLREIYNTDSVNGRVKINIDTSSTYGLSGQVSKDEEVAVVGGCYHSPIENENCSDIKGITALSADYYDPEFEKGFIFTARRLLGAKEIARVLKPSEWDPEKPFYPQIGFSNSVRRAHLSDAAHRMLSQGMRSWRRTNRGSFNSSYDNRFCNDSYTRVQSFSAFMQTDFRNADYNRGQQRNLRLSSQSVERNWRGNENPFYDNNWRVGDECSSSAQYSYSFEMSGFERSYASGYDKTTYGTSYPRGQGRKWGRNRYGERNSSNRW